MGARGAVAKPVELKLLENNRGHRPIDLTGLFRPEVGVPDMPKGIDREAKKAWLYYAPKLVHYNVLSPVDRDAFVMLCRTAGRVEELELAVAGRKRAAVASGKFAAEGLMDRTPNGYEVTSQLYNTLSKEQAKLNQLLAQFGLRPDARTKVSTAIRAQLTLFEGGKPSAPDAQVSAPAAGDGLPQSFGDFT